MHTKLKDAFPKLVKQSCPFSNHPLPIVSSCQLQKARLLLYNQPPPLLSSSVKTTGSLGTTQKYDSSTAAENRKIYFQVATGYCCGSKSSSKTRPCPGSGAVPVCEDFCKEVALVTQMTRMKAILPDS